MTSDRSLKALRQAFDDGFKSPRPGAPPATVPFLLVGAGTLKLALPAASLRGVARCPPLARVPGGRPELVGLGTHGHDLVGVYDLAALLGTTASAPTWMALCHDGTVGLAFHAVDGWARVAQDAVRPGPAGSTLEHLGTRAVVDVDALVRRLAPRSDPP